MSEVPHNRTISSKLGSQAHLEIDLLIFGKSKNRTGISSISCLFFDADRQLCIIQDHYKNKGYNASVQYDSARSTATFIVEFH